MIFAPTSTAPTPAQAAYAGLLQFNSTAFAGFVAAFQESFDRVWHRQDGVTAQQIFDQAGTGASAFFVSAQASVTYIGAVATANGQPLDAYLAPEDYTPPLPYTIHADGTVTVTPPAPPTQP